MTLKTKKVQKEEGKPVGKLLSFIEKHYIVYLL